MKSDLYTKIILIFIAVMLAVVAIKPLLSPQITVNAQSTQPAAFAGMQFSGTENDFTIFDSRTGDIWQYASANLGVPTWYHSKISELGKPLQVYEYVAAKPIRVK